MGGPSRLTIRKQHFVELYVADPELRGNALGCYRVAFPPRKRQRSVTTEKKEAARLMADPVVREAIERYRERCAEEAACTLAEHLEALMILRDRAADAEDYKAAIHAEELRGKASGHYRGKGDAPTATAALGVFFLPDKAPSREEWAREVRVIVDGDGG